MGHEKNSSRETKLAGWEVIFYILLAFGGGIIVCFILVTLTLLFLSYGNDMWSVLFDLFKFK